MPLFVLSPPTPSVTPYPAKLSDHAPSRSGPLPPSLGHRLLVAPLPGFCLAGTVANGSAALCLRPPTPSVTHYPDNRYAHAPSRSGPLPPPFGHPAIPKNATSKHKNAASILKVPRSILKNAACILEFRRLILEFPPLILKFPRRILKNPRRILKNPRRILKNPRLIRAFARVSQAFARSTRAFARPICAFGRLICAFGPCSSVRPDLHPHTKVRNAAERRPA